MPNMNGMEYVIAAVVGMIVGALVVWFAQKSALSSLTNRLAETENRTRAAEKDSADAKAEVAALKVRADQTARLEEQLANERAKVEDARRDVADRETRIAGLESKLQEQAEFFDQERKNHKAALEEQRQILDEAQQALKDAFGRLSKVALEENAESFLKIAEDKFKSLTKESEKELEHRQKAIDELVKPIKEGLGKLDEKTTDLEKTRAEAFAQLREQIEGIKDSHHRLHDTTSNLVKALRRPEQRGRWGEIQLENVIRMAGMTEHCDFHQQPQVTIEGQRLRPDVIVNLPGQGKIAIDSKAPIDAYLSAIETEDEAERERLIAQFVIHFRGHVDKLAAKEYWSGIESAGFVVMFVPGEAFFSAAFQKDPDLLDYAFRKGVAVANPTSLIALLKAIAYGWQQVTLAKNAEEVRDLARDLHQRIVTFASHMERIDKGLKAATKAYEEAAASLERRVLPQARKFQNLGVGVKSEIPTLTADAVLSLPEVEVDAEPGEEVLHGESAKDQP